MLRYLYIVSLICLITPFELMAEEGTDAADTATVPVAEVTAPLPVEPPKPRLHTHNVQLAQKRPGETLWWLDPEQEVLALYHTETTGTPRGAVLLLADLGQHAYWPGLQHALRDQLPWAGWHNLSVALPLDPLTANNINPADDTPTTPTEPERNTATDQAETASNENPQASAETPVAMQLRVPTKTPQKLAPRRQVIFALLDSARTQLQAKNLANQVIIAEGEALWWVTYWLAERSPEEIYGLVMLSPKTPHIEGAPTFESLLQELQIKQQLDFIRLPRDSLEQSRHREAAARRQKQSYQRITVSGQTDEQHARRLSSWLNRHLSGVEQTLR